MAPPILGCLVRPLWKSASRPGPRLIQHIGMIHQKSPVGFSCKWHSTNSPAKTWTKPSDSRKARGRPVSLFAAGGVLLALAMASVEPVQNNAQPTFKKDISDSKESGLPYYHLSDVKKHDTKSERPWVTYQGRIYDITDWVSAHPGGDVILRAAGGSIEPYWDIFSIHQAHHVREILEQYIIGHVYPDDLLNSGHDQIDDPFLSDPERDPRLRLLTQKPCNAESPSHELSNSFLTPNETFYVRNHMWVPEVDNGHDYDISVELPDGTMKSYTIGQLQSRFPQHTITAVMQCSGNRRKDMTDNVKKTNGLQWTAGAISYAKWEGVLLRDVLADAGLELDRPSDDARHVQFSGMEAYGASIPMSSALDPRGDVLLAMRMNDEILPRDHGFPIRVVVPGHVAARCVKWLKKIVVSDEESNTTWQRKDYKCFGPNETAQDWDKYKSIQEMPVTSAITRALVKQRPANNKTSPVHIIQVEGYAYSGGGRGIQRVDVSMDSGKTWDQANLLPQDAELERGNKSWCWKRWRYEAEIPPERGAHALAGDKGHRTACMVVKATDDAYNTQPESHECIYNLRGNLATAWHRMNIDLPEASANHEHGT